MEFLCVALVCLAFLVVIGCVFPIKMKKIKELGERPELDEIANGYPSNVEMCKEYLKKLGNEDVQVEEDKEATATMYIAVLNKIKIANLKQNYTRIQTMAHECIHSIQNKKIVMFHFIISNLFFVFFAVISIFALFKKLPNEMMFFVILSILGFVYAWVRCYLENDAMTRAWYLAKEYLEEKQRCSNFCNVVSGDKEIKTEEESILSNENVEKLLDAYKELNEIGIPCVNYQVLFSMFSKILIFAIICLW